MQYTFDNTKHIHKLEIDGKEHNLTGTSTAVGVINKGGLVWWASAMAVKVLGWTENKDKDKKWITKEARLKTVEPRFEEIKQLDSMKYLDLLDEAYYAHSKTKDRAAKDGTDLHALAEEWVKAQIAGTKIEVHEKLAPLVAWSKANVDKWLWSETHCFSAEHFVGGISDAGFIDKEGRVGIMDFKSSKEAYTSQFIQCAGYDVQITENGGYDSKGNKTFDLEGKTISYYAVLPFGMEKPLVQTRHNVDELKQGFLSAVCLHRLTGTDN